MVTWRRWCDATAHDRLPVITVKSTGLGSITIFQYVQQMGGLETRAERGYRILYLSDHRIKSKRRNREERAFAPSSWAAYDEQDEGIRNCDLALY
jgi:hypothetical protein